MRQTQTMYIRKLIGFWLVLAIGICSAPLGALSAGFDWAAGFPKYADGKVLLMWEIAPGADNYKIYRKRANGQYMLLTTTKVNRKIDADAEPGYTYTYKVVGVKGEAETGQTPEMAVTIKEEKVFVPLSAPKLEGGRVLGGAKDASVGLRWEIKDRATELAGYNIYRGLSEKGPYELAGTSQALDFEDTDVKRGKTYYYAVTAIDTSFNETKYSNIVSVEVPVIEMKVPEKKKPTAMRRASLLFNINGYKESVKNKKGEEELKDKAFEFPVDVVVDEAVGHIYVLSTGYGGILVYDMNGKFQFAIRKEGVGSDKKIKSAHGLGLGPDGLVYVASYADSAVYAYDFMGKLVRTIDPAMDADKLSDGKKGNQSDVAINSTGDVYMADPPLNRIHVYSSRGKHLFEMGPDLVKDKDEPKFNGPGFVAVDSKDNFYMIDTSFGRLLAYDRDGNFLKVVVESGVGMGEAGKLFYPTGISVDKDDNVYVANGLDPNIQAFDLEGNFIYAVANEKLDGPIKSRDIRGIYIDSQDRLYVTEAMKGTVAVYQLTGGTEMVTTPSRVEN